MRCITAICPAGPPNDRAATRSQTFMASPKGTPCGFGSVMTSSRSRPVVSLVDGIAAPAIEGVVERKPRLELRKIVGVHARQTERGGQEPRRFRCQFRSRRVGTAHDRRKPLQRLGFEAELLDHQVEGAALAAMAPVHVLVIDIERRGAKTGGDVEDLRRGDIKEDRLRIDKAADQPGAGDPIDLGPAARHPDGTALGIPARQTLDRHGRQLRRLPGDDAAFEHVRRTPSWRSHAATPWLSFRPFWQTTTAGRRAATRQAPRRGRRPMGGAPPPARGADWRRSLPRYRRLSVRVNRGDR